MRNRHLLTLTLLLAFAPFGEARSDVLDEWFQMIARTQAEQPHWIAPVFTPTARLEQMYVYDVSQQKTAKGVLTNLGGNRGLLLIPAEHINVVVTPPAYLEHDNPRIANGFADLGLVFKYRLAAENEEGRNYVVTAFVGTTVPTAANNNGAPHAVITPAIGFGKGWDHFEVQSTLGVGLPVRNASRVGTPVSYNTAFQYAVLKKIAPEVEINTTNFPNGPNRGKTQVFVSPGVVLGKFHLWRRLGFALGGGIQIAVTRFHTFNHNRILSLRFPF